MPIFVNVRLNKYIRTYILTELKRKKEKKLIANKTPHRRQNERNDTRWMPCTVKEIIGSNEIRLDDESTSLSSSPALCIQDADVCKPCTRFSVSPRINRIRRIVGTYNEFSPPVKLLHYVAASKREFPASLLRRFRPFQRGTRTICTR